MSAILVWAVAGASIADDDVSKSSRQNRVSNVGKSGEETAMSEPENPLTAPELIETDGLGLTKLITAEGVIERAPVNPETRFRLGSFERIYAYLEVKNPSASQTELTVGWVMPNQRETGTVSVVVGAETTWRTWAFTKFARKAGIWWVVVRDVTGKLLGRAAFEVLPAL